MSRSRWAASVDKQKALKDSEAAGTVADSAAVRHALLERVRSGEISLDESRKELKRIQRNAKRSGMQTRSSVWRNG